MLNQEIIKKYFEIFRLSVSKQDTVTESNSFEVYVLTLKSSEKVVLKIPFNSQKLEREKKTLELLNGKVCVPKVINYYEGDDTIPGALLISYIDGEPLTGNITEDLSYQMGVMLAKIHSISLKKYGEIETEGESDNPNVYIDSLREIYNKNSVFCEKVMDSKKLSMCNEIFDYYFSKLPTPDGSCLIHSDYRMGNILVKDSKVVGIIDFEVANGGLAEADFSLLKSEIFDIYNGSKESFFNGYKTIRKLPDLDNTLPFYEFLTAFSRIGWCIKRAETNEHFYFEFINKIDEIIEKYLSL